MRRSDAPINKIEERFAHPVDADTHLSGVPRRRRTCVGGLDRMWNVSLMAARVEARREAIAEAIFIVLESRGFTVSNDVRERIIGYGHRWYLKALLARAATINEIDELFA